MDDVTKKIVETMMADPTVEVELFRSMHQEGEEADDTSATFVPGQGRTIVLKVHGGANNVEITRVKTEDDEEG